MAIKSRTIVVIAFCGLMFAVALYLLAFGGAISCCSPTSPGGNFWQPEKFFYGLLPVCASLVTLAFAFRLWARAFVRRRNAWLVGSIIVTFAVVLDFTLFLKYRGRFDERIKVVWEAESSTFNWGVGEVKVPTGLTYKRHQGIDTLVGHFTSQDGKLTIEYDIGELASEHDGMGKSEKLIEGSRVRVGRATRSNDKGIRLFFSEVSFPDSGCANFSLESPNEQDAAAIELIASSFRPTGWMPSWVRQCLPEVLRSDCRYRFKLPIGF